MASQVGLEPTALRLTVAAALFPQMDVPSGKSATTYCVPLISKGGGASFHNKMELINRQAYGFRNFENYRLRVKVLCS